MVNIVSVTFVADKSFHKLCFYKHMALPILVQITEIFFTKYRDLFTFQKPAM